MKKLLPQFPAGVGLTIIDPLMKMTGKMKIVACASKSDAQRYLCLFFQGEALAYEQSLTPAQITASARAIWEEMDSIRDRGRAFEEASK